MTEKRERTAAPGLFVELLDQPVEQWEDLLAATPRFHTWGVFELLVERSLEVTLQDPAYGETLGLPFGKQWGEMPGGDAESRTEHARFGQMIRGASHEREPEIARGSQLRRQRG